MCYIAFLSLILNKMAKTERNKLLLKAAKDGDTEQFNNLFKTSNVDVNMKNEVLEYFSLLGSSLCNYCELHTNIYSTVIAGITIFVHL